MSHSQFHCTGRVYLDLHGLIFETSICYWQDQPGSPGRERRRWRAAAAAVVVVVEIPVASAGFRGDSEVLTAPLSEVELFSGPEKLSARVRENRVVRASSAAADGREGPGPGSFPGGGGPR